jgi:flagellar hook-associated protein 2
MSGGPVVHKPIARSSTLLNQLYPAEATMAGITFGGLATGMDTSSIIENLMQVERLPVTRLETKKAAQTQRADAFQVLDVALKKLRDSVSDMSLTSQVRTSTATLSTDEYFRATATSDASGSYQVEVIDLAQVGKQYFQAYASKTESILPTGSLTLTINDTDFEITVDSENNSLEGVAAAINELDAGVTAGVMFDGDNYRLTLTGDEVTNTFSLTDNLEGGGMALTLSEPPSRAHVTIDGLDVYSDTNTITDAIPNLTLNLTQAQEETRTAVTVTVGEDSAGVKDKILAFVDAYNEVMTFIADGYNEAVIAEDEDLPGGLVLRGDSAVNSVKRQLQSLLTASVATAGSYQSLADLGLSTNRDGTLSVATSALDSAINSDFDSVATLLVGDDSNAGVMKPFKSYLLDATSSYDGVYATAKARADSTIETIDSQIDRIEQRLEIREKAIRAQFTVLEALVSSMNETSSFLTQQSDMLKNLWSN